MSDKKNNSGDSAAAKASTTISTRLDEEQRKLIEYAAEIKNWSPAKLMRVAALEKAAAIVNLNEPRSFDFQELARSIALQLVKPGYRLLDNIQDGDVDVTDTVHEVVGNDKNSGVEYLVDVVPDKLNRAEIDRFARALRLGGTEFLQLVLSYCDRLDPASKRNLEDPIDPTELVNR